MKNFILAGLCLFGLFSIYSHADIVVIASTQSAITQASDKDIQRLFLGKGKAIGGTTATPVNNKQHIDAFSQATLKKTEKQLKAYWSKLIFTGKGRLPDSASNDAEAIAAVTANTEAITYIDSASVTPAVKVIFTP